MKYQHPDRILKAVPEYEFCTRINWKNYRAIVIESDDWGMGIPDYGLETVEDLEHLFRVLEEIKGSDGQPAVFTAFACMSNPDYEAIEASGFEKFIDTGPDKDSPVCKKWREGIATGVFFPEYHSNLHHTSPVIWMELLRGNGPESERARDLFNKRRYSQGYHIPEFLGMNIKEINQWVKIGLERFYEAVGYKASVAVTSDAYPETEIIWSIHGIKAVSLKNSRNNYGEVVVYDTKPWNNQNPWVPMGAYNRFYDLIYLVRNVSFECTSKDEGLTDEFILSVIEKRWENDEPAVIQSHRAHYVGVRRDSGLDRLARLLSLLAKKPNVRFLTSAEICCLYRQGWSMRLHKKGYLLRKWTDDTQTLIMERPIKKITLLPNGDDFSDRIGKDGCSLHISQGDYLVEFT